MTSAWWVNEGDLDEDQVKVATLPKQGNHVLIGPPGSGKTNLLLLRARYLYLSSMPDILVLVFTRTLQEFLRMGAAQYGFPVEKILNYRQWQIDFLRQNGCSISKETDFGKARLADFLSIEKVINDKKLGASYDAVFVDEAQDYSSHEIRILAALGKVFYAAADQRQRIYSGEEPFGAFEALATIHRLRFHYRNGRQICRLADGIAKNLASQFMLTPTSQYDEDAKPSSVKSVPCRNLNEEVTAIASAVESELRAYPGEMIAILCPRQEDLTAVWDILKQTSVAIYCQVQTSKFGYDAFQHDKPICVCSFHSAKGLEFRTVHLAASEFIRKFELQRNMAYTAVTRAKTKLTVYHVDPLPGYVESAFARLASSVKTPTLAQLFGMQK